MEIFGDFFEMIMNRTICSKLRPWALTTVETLAYAHVSTSRTLGELIKDFQQQRLQNTPYSCAVIDRFSLKVINVE